MRPIKFRAWDKQKRRLIEHSMLFRLDTTNEIPFLPLLEKFIPEYEVMQYTGLKDKNGTEIYEGDIISCLWGNDDYTGLVKFSEGAFVVQPFLHEWETLISELNEVEVVNDIYESKELLERDEE